MEYVRGTDLKSAIQQRGAINQRKVAEIGSQVCQALSVAHGQDIMHRDIKPQNIMVQPDGNVKVMDFGIARAKNSVKAKTSSVLGTAHYISPEQAQGKELDGASDIYSLGCVLYEAATGQLPFDGPDAVSVAMRQVNEAPLPPSQVKPDISPDLEAIIMKAMEKNPYNRFQTVRDMKHALDDFLMGRPVTGVAGAVSSAPTAVMGGVGSMNTMAMGAEGGTAVMPAVGPGTSGPMQATSFRMDDDAKKKSNKKTIGIVVGYRGHHRHRRHRHGAYERRRRRQGARCDRPDAGIRHQGDRSGRIRGGRHHRGVQRRHRGGPRMQARPGRRHRA